MSKALELIIIVAHFSIYGVAALNIWIFHRRSDFFRNVVKLRSIPLIYCGFACAAIGASYEIAEHIGDNWIYVNHISELNRLFYTFISASICLIALGLKRSTLTDILLIACWVAVPILYGVGGGKDLMQWPQRINLIIFIYHWYIVMRDWRVFLYPILSTGLALGLGIALIVTGNQIFHVFIGPVSGLGLLMLGYVAWVQPERERYRQS